eukprot:1271834-Alexandrium_andersonii.AAC.1
MAGLPGGGGCGARRARAGGGRQRPPRPVGAARLRSRGHALERRAAPPAVPAPHGLRLRCCTRGHPPGRHG